MKSQDPSPRSGSASLSDFIRHHQAAILADRERRARAQVGAQALARPLLVDHIPALLLDIAELIGRIQTGGNEELPQEAARIHAVTRLEAGFDLNQVISELTLLRDAILGCCERTGMAALQQNGLRALNSAIDKAIVAAVEHYLQAQHSTLSSLDKISAVALESRTLSDFLERLLRVVLDTMATVDTAAVLLLEDDMLWVRAAVGLEEEIETGFGLPVGEGFAGRVAAERRPLLLAAEEVGASVKSDILRRRGVRALYGVPLLHGEELVGVVHIGSLTAPGFSEQDRLMLGSMASRATAAIVQHSLRAAAELRSRQQYAVAELGAFALQCEDPRRVMEHTVAMVAKVLAPAVAVVEQLDPAGSLVARAQTGDWPSLWPVTPGSQAEHVLAAAKPVIVHDYRSEVRFAYPPPLRERGILSAMMVSIRVPGAQPGRPYGVIGAYSRRQHTFSSQDVVFLQTISCIVASAIFHAQSVEALRSIGIGKDLGERKHTDLERERLLRELEQAVRFREDILATVSHDLRSPLAAINLSASLLARRALADSNARVHKQLEIILRASGRMERLISNLLDLANIQAGRLVVEPEACDAATLLEEATEFHAPAAVTKGVKIDAALGLQGVQVYCDHARIQQVFSHLLSNAIKFSDSGTTIRMRAMHEGGYVRFTVADRGPGIAPELLSHIFEPYWSAEGQARKGAGLGLFVAKGIVEAHKGRLWVDSALGEGSAFHFTLPVLEYRG